MDLETYILDCVRFAAKAHIYNNSLECIMEK
jgi:hypothetical protein